MVACVACCNTPSGENYKTKGGMIVFDEPARAEGQESMLGFAAISLPIQPSLPSGDIVTIFVLGFFT